MKFSINFPTRDRLLFVINLLNSLKLTTFDLKSIEINIGIDLDDLRMNEEKENLLETFSDLIINFYKFERNENIISYQNALAKLSNGEYIIVICDDAEFNTKDWDKIVYEILESKNKPVLGAVEDNNGMLDMFTCFPIVSRDFVDTCRYIFDDRCWVWGADVRLGMLFNKIGKYVKIPEVVISHLKAKDDIHKRVEKINHDHPNSDDDKWINETMEKLNAVAAR